MASPEPDPEYEQPPLPGDERLTMPWWFKWAPFFIGVCCIATFVDLIVRGDGPQFSLVTAGLFNVGVGVYLRYHPQLFR